MSPSSTPVRARTDSPGSFCFRHANPIMPGVSRYLRAPLESGSQMPSFQQAVSASLCHPDAATRCPRGHLSPRLSQGLAARAGRLHSPGLLGRGGLCRVSLAMGAMPALSPWRAQQRRPPTARASSLFFVSFLDGSQGGTSWGWLRPRRRGRSPPLCLERLNRMEVGPHRCVWENSGCGAGSRACTPSKVRLFLQCMVYLLAALGLCCCVWARSRRERGTVLCQELPARSDGFSAVEHVLGAGGLSVCGSWAWRPHGRWRVSGPGIELVSPALAGGFLTPGPLGKSPWGS